MQMYLNDSVKTFEFVLQGELTADTVPSLEHAWITARSILHGKEVFVNVSALTAADAEGIDLLSRITASGARLKAAPQSRSMEFLRSMGVILVAPSRRGRRSWAAGLRRLLGLVA